MSSKEASSSPAGWPPLIRGNQASRGIRSRLGWQMQRPKNSSAPCGRSKKRVGASLSGLHARSRKHSGRQGSLSGQGVSIALYQDVSMRPGPYPHRADKYPLPAPCFLQAHSDLISGRQPSSPSHSPHALCCLGGWRSQGPSITRFLSLFSSRFPGGARDPAHPSQQQKAAIFRCLFLSSGAFHGSPCLDKVRTPLRKSSLQSPCSSFCLLHPSLPPQGSFQGPLPSQLSLNHLRSLGPSAGGKGGTEAGPGGTPRALIPL